MVKIIIMIFVVSFALHSVRSLNEFVSVDNAIVMCYMHNRQLPSFPDVTNCYSIDSVRIIDADENTYTIWADYGEQEVFPYQPKVLDFFRQFRKIQCYTESPYNNHYISGGNRYMAWDNDSTLIICFKTSCILRRMIPDVNCWLDTTIYRNPQNEDNVKDDAIVEYCHYWDDYVDNRTFWIKEYYVIDSVLSYCPLDTFEMRGLNLRKIDNTTIINKYGTW